MSEQDELKKQLETGRGGGGRKGRTAVGAHSGGKSPSSNRRTAIVCDRSDLVRAGVIAMIADLLEVIGDAQTGIDAIKIVAQGHPDVVILDLDLDGVGPLELCKELVTKTAVVVVTNSHLATKHFYQLMRAGVRGLCLKSSGPTVLREAVATESGTKPFCDPRIAAMIDQDSVRDLDDRLTFTERKILVRLSLLNQEIAEELDLDVTAVVEQVESIMRKLHVATRTAALVKAVSIGCIPLPKMSKIDTVSGKTEKEIEAERFASEAIEKRGR